MAGRIRVGNGFDAHRFKPGVPLVLGGVNIPHAQGLEAHSDGDVVLHALCDAILGALAMGDIGQHFPDSDASYRGVDSRNLLRHVYALMQRAGYRLVNADLTVIAQAPKLAEHIPQMRQCIADDLHAGLAAISVKATTTERMGFTGREEGIAALATVMLENADDKSRPDIEL